LQGRAPGGRGIRIQAIKGASSATPLQDCSASQTDAILAPPRKGCRLMLHSPFVRALGHARRVGPMLTLLAFAIEGAEAASQVKYDDIAGHSIERKWAETTVLLDPAGREKRRRDTIDVISYLGAKGHLFSHVAIDRGTGAPVETSDGVTLAGEQRTSRWGALGEWRFEEGALIFTMAFRNGGASRRIVHFARSKAGLTCTFEMKNAYQPDTGPIMWGRDKLISVVYSEISCNVTEGNLIAERP
jgi:hypothetical protein